MAYIGHPVNVPVSTFNEEERETEHNPPADNVYQYLQGTPDWTFGLNLNASWKNIDFSMLLSGAMELLDGYEILELARTGITGLKRGSDDVIMFD